MSGALLRSLLIVMLGLGVGWSAPVHAKRKSKLSRAERKALRAEKKAKRAEKRAKKKAKRKAKKKAKKVLKKGKRLAKKKNFSAAITKFSKATELYPTGEAFYRQGRCHLALDQRIEAASSFEQGLAVAKKRKWKRKLKKARKKLYAALSKTHNQLTLKAYPKGTQIKLVNGDETLEGEAPWRLWLKLGTWELSAQAAGHEPYDQQLILGAGKPAEPPAIRLVRKKRSKTRPAKQPTKAKDASDKKSQVAEESPGAG